MTTGTVQQPLPRGEESGDRGEESGDVHVLLAHLAREAGSDPAAPEAGERFLQLTGDLLYRSGEAHFQRVLVPVMGAVIASRGGFGAEDFHAWLTGIGVDPLEAEEVFRRLDAAGPGPLASGDLLAAIRDYHFGSLSFELLG